MRLQLSPKLGGGPLYNVFPLTRNLGLNDTNDRALKVGDVAVSRARDSANTVAVGQNHGKYRACRTRDIRTPQRNRNHRLHFVRQCKLERSRQHGHGHAQRRKPQGDSALQRQGQLLRPPGIRSVVYLDLHHGVIDRGPLGVGDHPGSRGERGCQHHGQLDGGAARRWRESKWQQFGRCDEHSVQHHRPHHPAVSRHHCDGSHQGPSVSGALWAAIRVRWAAPTKPRQRAGPRRAGHNPHCQVWRPYAAQTRPGLRTRATIALVTRSFGEA